MKVFNSLDSIKCVDNTALALGNFDGMHRGHVALVTKAVDRAKELGLKSAVFTFSNHPQNLISGKTKIKNIMYHQEKSRILSELGVDYLFSIPFTESIHVMSPEEFVDNLLIGAFRMKEVYCGFNYHFGIKASGTSEMLIEFGKEKGFEVDIMEPFKIDGQLVSSTLIRGLITNGKMEECNKFLGRNYTIEGTVQVGNKIGRTIGFPTSNIEIDGTMVQPSHGVYVTLCDYCGTSYQAVTNVGIRPTIGDEKKTVETYIFNFNKELYGKNIRVEFLSKIRDELKFDSIEELAARISRDKDIAAEYHAKRAR